MDSLPTSSDHCYKTITIKIKDSNLFKVTLTQN